MKRVKTVRLTCSILVCVVFASMIYLSLNKDTTPPLITSLVLAKAIPEVRGNLSGITWDASTQTLLAVTNKPEKLFRLDKKGNVISTYPLSGMEDTESIAYGWDNTYLVAEERLRKITTITLSQHEKSYRKLAPSLTFDLAGKRNDGLEGVAYSRANDTLYIANEKNPATIFKIAGFNRHPQQLAIERIYNTAKDISGLAWCDRRQRLYVLSDEAKNLVEIDSKGAVHRVSALSDLTNNLPQPEGVTVNGDTVYVVSEPNLFYVFKLASVPTLDLRDAG